MPTPLNDPTNWLIAAVALAASWAVGRLYRDPWWVVAANALGGAAFVVGIRWAASLGPEAGIATLVATGGMALSVSATHRRRSTTQADAGAVSGSPRG